MTLDRIMASTEVALGANYVKLTEARPTVSVMQQMYPKILLFRIIRLASAEAHFSPNCIQK